MDGAPHRAGKAAVYNHYADTHADIAYEAAFEREQPLIRPLYPSGWWLADRVQQGHPARVLISSASSKTALSAAAQLRRRGGAELVALTSARHQTFVAKPGGLQRPMKDLAGPPPELLFVPDYAARRMQTDRALGATLMRDLRDFYAESRAYFTVRREEGTAAITSAWSRLSAARTSPGEGLVLSF